MARSFFMLRHRPVVNPVAEVFKANLEQNLGPGVGHHVVERPPEPLREPVPQWVSSSHLVARPAVPTPALVGDQIPTP